MLKKNHLWVELFNANGSYFNENIIECCVVYNPKQEYVEVIEVHFDNSRKFVKATDLVSTEDRQTLEEIAEFINTNEFILTQAMETHAEYSCEQYEMYEDGKADFLYEQAKDRKLGLA